jgi:hypothetical protein
MDYFKVRSYEGFHYVVYCYFLCYRSVFSALCSRTHAVTDTDLVTLLYGNAMNFTFVDGYQIRGHRVLVVGEYIVFI